MFEKSFESYINTDITIVFMSWKKIISQDHATAEFEMLHVWNVVMSLDTMWYLHALNAWMLAIMATFGCSIQALVNLPKDTIEISKSCFGTIYPGPKWI